MMMRLVIWNTMHNLSIRETREHKLMIISLSGITIEQECTIHSLTFKICPSEERNMED